MIYYGNDIYALNLYHHGILGQKWGIRRYQNYDGTYTKAGLVRYRQKYSTYEEKQNALKNARMSYKEGSISKEDYKKVRKESSESKKDVKQAYKDLKEDKLADQGKKLVEKGYSHKFLKDDVKFGKAGLTVASLAGNAYVSVKMSNKIAAIVPSLTKKVAVNMSILGKEAVGKMLTTELLTAATPGLIASGTIMAGTITAKQILNAYQNQQEKKLEAYYRKLGK